MTTKLNQKAKAIYSKVFWLDGDNHGVESDAALVPTGATIVSREVFNEKVDIDGKRKKWMSKMAKKALAPKLSLIKKLNLTAEEAAFLK